MRAILIGAAGIALAACVAPLSVAHAAQDRAGDPAREQSFGRALDSFIRKLRDSPNAVPGTVVVVVHGGRTIFERAYGVRDLSTGAPLTLDTPVYNASVTKAYTGLLAAMLDADGTLPISFSINDVWPNLTLPAPLDPSKITIGHLLSHSSGMRAGGLNHRSVTTGDIRLADVPEHLRKYAEPRAPGFAYDNLGPFIWSSMAYARTGMLWQDLLQQRILTPLGLRHTSGRLEDLGPDQIARCHPRVSGGWTAIPPKPTAVLNAAGGMYASGRDEATFLKAFLTDGRSANGRIPAALLRRTWQKQSDQDTSMWGLHRDGYGLGWDLGTIAGHRFVSRSGGYPGCRAISMFFPTYKLGVVAMSNGDAGANTYHATILAQAADLWARPDKAKANAARRVADLHKVSADAVRSADVEDPRLAKARAVDPQVRIAALGRYRNDRLGEVQIVDRARELVVVGGVFSAPLRYLGEDRFMILGDFGTAVRGFDLVRDANGRVSGFVWDDDRYDRMT